jgi:hypothetical protein
MAPEMPRESPDQLDATDSRLGMPQAARPVDSRAFETRCPPGSPVPRFIFPLWTPRDLPAITGGHWVQLPDEFWLPTGLTESNKHLCPGDFFITTNVPNSSQANDSEPPSRYSADLPALLRSLHGRGISGAMLQSEDVGLPPNLPVLRVGDSVQAVLALAKAARERTRAKIIAVTGTAGRFGAREMIRHVLSQADSAFASRANYDMDFRIALSLAQLPADCGFGVLEIALSALRASHRSLSSLIRPQLAIITTTQIDPVQAVQAPEETAEWAARIFQGLEPGGIAIINRDMPMFQRVRDMARDYGVADICLFGEHPEADVRLLNADVRTKFSVASVRIGDETLEYEVPLPGRIALISSLATLASVKSLNENWQQAAQNLADIASTDRRLKKQSQSIRRTSTDRQLDPGATNSRHVHLCSRSRLDICVAGDIYFGEMHQKRRESNGKTSYLKKHGYGYLLQDLARFLQSADFVVANLETPLTYLESSPFKGRFAGLLFGDPQSTTRALREHNIGAVSLANNHALDYGLQGHQDTLAELNAAGVICLGAGGKLADAIRPLEINAQIRGVTLPIVVFTGYEYSPNWDRVFASYASEDRPGVVCLDAKLVEEVAKARGANPGAFIIAYPHWGRNFRWRYNLQMEMADSLVHAGADLIIGHGAHMMLEVERAHGRWVLFGLGNLAFGCDGEYNQRGLPPFSLATRLCLRLKNGRINKDLLVYPIMSDNRFTLYRPRLVTANEFLTALETLRRRCPDLDPSNPLLSIGRDEHGWYLRLELQAPDMS